MTLDNLSFCISPLLIFGISTPYILYPQYLAWRWGKASKRWPRIRGKITYSGITSYNRGYLPKVEYEYVVGQQYYKGKRVQFGVRTNISRNQAQEAIASYDVGKRVTVRYHPNNPKLSILEPGISNFHLAFGFVISALIGGLGLAWTVFALGLLVG